MMRTTPRWRAIAIALAFVATTAGCGSDGSDDAAAASVNLDAPAPEAPAGVAEFADAEPGSGEGLKVGFTQLTLAAGFPQDVQKGVDEQAERAGLDVTTCDSKADAAVALECARQFKTQGVDALITFQADTNASPRICEAGPQVPVIAVDIEQPPCQTSFMGAANSYAGELVGWNVGQYFGEEFDCEYDAFVSLESKAVGEVNDLRMGGIRDGFESVCGDIHDLKQIDTGPGGLAEPAQRQMTDTLTALPGAKRVIVVGINEDVILGALAAARSQDRSDDLYLGVQNLNPKNCAIYTAPHWLGSVAYFPERYGQILIPNIIKLAKGESVPEELLVPHEWITADDVEQAYPSYAC